jgi:hypothetical protein
MGYCRKEIASNYKPSINIEMKRQILISLILLSAGLSLKAQVYGTIAGSSGSNNVGIGTSTPSATLSVFGGISKLTTTGYDRNFDNLIKYGVKSDLESGTALANRWHGIDATITAGGAADNKLKFRLYSGGFGNIEPIDVLTLLGNGNVGIGITSPVSPLTLRNSSLTDVAVSGSIDLTFATTSDGWGTKISTFKETNNCAGMAFFTQYGWTIPVERMRISSTGYVGIGTISPAYPLDVCGTIRAREVKVDLQGTCPDFVFKNDYKLMDIMDLENFVKTNKHLPEIASEKEMIANGININELQMKLLQKIEELTLYTIEQNKAIEELKQALKLQNEKIEKIESASIQ